METADELTKVCNPLRNLLSIYQHLLYFTLYFLFKIVHLC